MLHIHSLRSLALTIALLAMSTASIAGCKKKDDNKPAPDTAAPTIVSVFPGSGSTNASLNTSITAQFSEAMSAGSVTGVTFSATETAGPAVAGTVSIDSVNHSARLVPTGMLVATTSYTVTITIGVRDLAGNAIASPFTFSFTTGTASDITPPTVTSVDPLNSATDVPLNRSVSVVFSESMDTSTLTTASFTLSSVATPSVIGVVTCSGSTAVLNPSANLAASTLFTATITAAVADKSGISLVTAFAWSFTTGTTVSVGPAPVLLGKAGEHVVLAKTGVSTTGATAVTGNLGLSPAAGTFFTGFSETLDGSGVFATAPIVTGQMFAANYAVPTPANLTTAVLDMQTAFTDAAGRTNPDATELGAGNIDGMTITPGLYKWGTGVLIPVGVTLSGGVNDVWIFQIAEDLTLGNGAILTLIGGAQAKNVFWQVSGQVTLGTTVQFHGIILSQTAIVFETSSSLTGRALAQTAVTLDATAITAP
jgi:hypothetical protein